MNIRITTAGDAPARLREHARRTAPAARAALATELRANSLEETAVTTPVRTGRARRGWTSAAGNGGGEGFATEFDGTGRSSRTATNTVPYVPYLEYGTSRLAPRRIVRRALVRTAALACRLFRLSEGTA